MFRAYKKDLIVVLILIGVCGLFFWRLLLPGQEDRLMFPLGDFSYQFYSWRSLVYQALRSGQLPLWTPAIYSGYPLQADPQSALFYPLSVLFNVGALLVGVRTFPFRLLELEVIFHVFLASLFLYLLLRGQLRRRSSALLGGIVFAYGGYLTSYPLLQMAILESAIWLPLALLGIWRRYKLGKRHALWLTALAFTMSILAGHPQTSMLLIYATLSYQAYYLYRTQTRWYLGLRDVLFLLAMTAGLSAVQLLPSWQYMRFSSRAKLSLAQAGAGFPLEDLVQFVLTGLVSLWHPLYIGIWPLLLVGIGLVLPNRRRGEPGSLAIRSDKVFWYAFTSVAFLLSFGDRLLGFDLAYLLLPGYRLFQRQERLAFLISFGLSVLAACSMDSFWQAWSRPVRRRVANATHFLKGLLGLLFIALLVVVALHRQGLDPSDSGQLPKHVAILFLAMTGSVLLLEGRLYVVRSSRLWRALSLVLVAVNLFATNRDLNQVPLKAAYPVTRPIVLMREDQSMFRYQDDDRLPPQSACFHGLEETWGIAPIRPANYVHFLESAPEAVRWKLLNVKYVITWRADLVSREGVVVPADVVYQQGEGKDALYVHRLREPGPRAWIVRGVYVARNEDELYGYMRSPYFDPRRAAILREPLLLPTLPSDAQDEITIAIRKPMQIRIKTRLDAEGLLVLSEVNYPGWQAYVNGRATRIYEAYGILRAVLLPAGESVVEFRYRPLTFFLGAGLSLCAWLLWIGMALVNAFANPPATSRGENGE